MRTATTFGHRFIKWYEGCKLTAYYCPNGRPTIGWGHTKTVTAEDVRNGRTISERTARRLFRQDVKEAARYVDLHVRVPLTDNQFDALTSFVFNLGPGHFRDSTLLYVLNKGDYLAVPEQLCRWRYAGEVPLAGLAHRRVKEAALFMKPGRPSPRWISIV